MDHFPIHNFIIERLEMRNLERANSFDHLRERGFGVGLRLGVA